MSKNVSKQNCKQNNWIWTAFFVLIGIYMLSMYINFNIDLEVILKFIALNLISILLPGFALLCLFGIKQSRIGTVCTTYILGYGTIIFQYFISELFNRKISFKHITFLVAIISGVIITYYIKERKIQIEWKSDGKDIIDFIVLTLYMGFNVLGYAANYLGTDVVPSFNTWRDIQYWMNNTVALKISWPADNLFMIGSELNYHYFSNIPIAFLCDVYKIDVFSMSFPLYVITKTIVVVGAVIFLLDTLEVSNKMRILGNLLILFTTGVEVVSVATYVQQLLLLPFGFDIGFAYGMMFVSLLVQQWKKEKFDYGIFVGTLLVWAMCVGAKAPIASVLIIFAAIICFYWLIQKKWLLAFGYGIPVLIIFLVICKWCVGMFSVVSGDAAWSLSFYDMETIVNLANPEHWDILSRFLVRIGRRNLVFAIIVHFIMINPVVVLSCIVMLSIIVTNIIKKKVSVAHIFLLCALGISALVGLGLAVFVNAGGDSEEYFSMAALIPMITFLLYTIEEYWSKWELRGRIVFVKKSFETLFVILLIIGMYRFLLIPRNGEGMVEGAVVHCKIGCENIYHSINNPEYFNRGIHGIRDTDVEALEWIRDNAEPDALIMTDKAIITENPAFYMYGIFCERQQYLEGTNMLDFTGEREIVQREIQRRKEIIKNVYSNDSNAIEKAQKEGIDYVVQTLDITPEFKYDEEYFELVESSETVKIYKVR